MLNPEFENSKMSDDGCPNDAPDNNQLINLKVNPENIKAAYLDRPSTPRLFGQIVVLMTNPTTSLRAKIVYSN